MYTVHYFFVLPTELAKLDDLAIFAITALFIMIGTFGIVIETNACLKGYNLDVKFFFLIWISESEYILNWMQLIRDAAKKFFLVVRPLRPYPPPAIELSGHRNFFFWSKISKKKRSKFLVTDTLLQKAS